LDWQKLAPDGEYAKLIVLISISYAGADRLAGFWPPPIAIGALVASVWIA
jgi:hypothetical protein